MHLERLAARGWGSRCPVHTPCHTGPGQGPRSLAGPEVSLWEAPLGLPGGFMRKGVRGGWLCLGPKLGHTSGAKLFTSRNF